MSASTEGTALTALAAAQSRVVAGTLPYILVTEVWGLLSRLRNSPTHLALLASARRAQGFGTMYGAMVVIRLMQESMLMSRAAAAATAVPNTGGGLSGTGRGRGRGRFKGRFAWAGSVAVVLANVMARRSHIV